jgi:protein-tyrosine phosphatase
VYDRGSADDEYPSCGLDRWRGEHARFWWLSDGRWSRGPHRSAYRSGNTHEISAEGLAHLAVQLGLRTVVDLRSARERSRALSEFEAQGIRNVHEPLAAGIGVDPAVPLEALTRSMADGSFDWAELYWNLLRFNMERFGRILSLLAEPNALPVLVHCAGGRDRTGVTTALMQAVLGVRRKHIADDFALSSQLLALGAPGPEFDRLFGNITDIPREDIVRALTTRPETMLALLARIDEHLGSIGVLIEMLDISRVVRDVLRARLTEQAPTTPRVGAAAGG